MIFEDKKAVALRRVYLDNVIEAINAGVTTGQYRYIEFKVDLNKGEVFHSLSVTNGGNIVVVQRDSMRYDRRFKTEFLEKVVDAYSRKGKVTVQTVHDHTIDPTPSNSASLKTISDANNILCVNNAEIAYINTINSDITRVQKGLEQGVLKYTNPRVSGIVNALVLAFLVGLFDGSILMVILNFILK